MHVDGIHITTDNSECQACAYQSKTKVSTLFSKSLSRSIVSGADELFSRKSPDDTIFAGSEGDSVADG